MNETGRQHVRDGEHAGSRYALAPPGKPALGASGIHAARRSGSSMEFREHREYQPGDDLRNIDWAAYARSDVLAVKVFHEEVNPHVDLIVDVSRSMALGDGAKSRATLGLAGLLAAAASNAGFSRAAWVAREECRPVANSAGRPSAWGAIDFDFAGSPVGSIAGRTAAWRPRGIRCLLSDLLWECEPLRILGHLVENATAVVVVQILAEADVVPPGPGNLRLHDVESGQVRELWVEAAARAHYQAALARHQQSWHRACRQVGAVFTTVVAEQLVRDWRLDDLVAARVLEII